jgi:hypothetical protein
MATEKIRVGIIATSIRNGWARDAHSPALSALPEFEITAPAQALERSEIATPRPTPHACGLTGRNRGPNDR